MKKLRVKIVIDEAGDPKFDILDHVGPTCASEAKEWAELAGGGVSNVVRKPEYFRQANKAEQKQTLKNQ